MNRTSLSIATAMVVGAMIGLLVGSGKSVSGQGQGNNLASHHQELCFNYFHGEVKPFPIPVQNRSVRADVSFTNVIQNNGQPGQGAVATILVVYDSASGVVSVVQGSTDSAFAAYGCGGSAGIRVGPTPGTLEIFPTPGETSCSTTTPMSVCVTMWY